MADFAALGNIAHPGLAEQVRNRRPSTRRGSTIDRPRRPRVAIGYGMPNARAITCSKMPSAVPAAMRGLLSSNRHRTLVNYINKSVLRPRRDDPQRQPTPGNRQQTYRSSSGSTSTRGRDSPRRRRLLGSGQVYQAVTASSRPSWIA
jgi:hypothetical protein